MRAILLLALRLSLLCLLPLLPLCCATEVSYQAHSYNDLRQWPSLILKGATWLKVDFQYATPTFCLTHSTSTARVHNGTHGCFLLNHDPLTLYRSSPYNTSDDVLHLLDQLAADPWLHSSHSVSIALCHKFNYGDVCANSTDSSNWRLLMQSFYTQAQRLISRHNLSLIFVEDGSGAIDTSSPCLTDMFDSWPSTYIPGSNAAEALYRNDTPTYARMDLLNMQAGTFYNVSAQHYGKFLPSPYPFLLWEPSDQPTLLNYTQHYMQGPRHPQGFRFAINIDPVQFAVYTANATGDAWNHRTDELRGRSGGQPAIVTYDDTPYLAVLSSKAVEGRGSDGYSVTVFAFDGLLTNQSLRAVQTLALPAVGVVDMFTAVSPPAEVPSSAPLLVMTAYDAVEGVTMTVFSIPVLASWRTLKPLFFHGIPMPPSSGPVAHDVVWHAADLLLLVQLVAITSPPSVLLRVFAVNVTSRTVILAVNGSNPTPALSTVTGVAVAMAGPPYSDGDSQCGSQAVPGALSYSLDNYSVYVSTFCLRNASVQLSPAVLMDVGSSPSLSIQRSPDLTSTLHFLLTLGESYCWNTEAYNKQADAGLCDHTPLPMASTLTYSYGLLSALTAYVQKRVQGGGEGGGVVCNAEFLHGTYDLGQRPRGRLWVGRDGEDVERLGVVEVHDGASLTGMEEEDIREDGDDRVGIVPSSICGVAVPFDGIVVDAWPLPQRTSWSSFSQAQVEPEAPADEQVEVDAEVDEAAEPAPPVLVAE